MYSKKEILDIVDSGVGVDKLKEISEKDPLVKSMILDVKSDVKKDKPRIFETLLSGAKLMCEGKTDEQKFDIISSYLNMPRSMVRTMDEKNNMKSFVEGVIESSKFTKEQIDILNSKLLNLLTR